MIELLIGYLIAMAGWIASFYLWSQWLVYRKLRSRFRICKPYLGIGWGLWLVGGSLLEPIGKMQHSAPLETGGALAAIVGVAAVIFAAVRLLVSNAVQRRIAHAAGIPQPEGVWPPPPTIPPA